MKKWIVSCVLALMMGGAFAQGLGFTSHATPGLSDTLIKGTNITYGVTVQSTGLLPVPGNYTVYVSVLDSAANLQYVDSVNVTSNSLQPGDSTQVIITHNVDPVKFLDGGNTVVIWPAAPFVLTTDTIFKDVFVINFNETPEYTLNHLVIYPNPASEFILIRTEATVEKVRIWDMSGKLVYSGSQNMLPVNSFLPGTYLIEVITSDQSVMRRKICIQK